MLQVPGEWVVVVQTAAHRDPVSERQGGDETATDRLDGQGARQVHLQQCKSAHIS